MNLRSILLMLFGLLTGCVLGLQLGAANQIPVHGLMFGSGGGIAFGWFVAAIDLENRISRQMYSNQWEQT